MSTAKGQVVFPDGTVTCASGPCIKVYHGWCEGSLLEGELQPGSLPG